MFVFRIGFSYIIGVNMGYGAIGVWIAMVLDWIFRVICFVSRYLSGHWLKTAELRITDSIEHDFCTRIGSRMNCYEV